MSQHRDHALDMLKGISCVMMILAHVPHSDMNGYFTQLFPPLAAILAGISPSIQFLGSMAPALFFSVAGVTSLFQTYKKTKDVILFYVMFAILGFTFNIFDRPNYWEDPVSNMLQVIACGAVVLFLIDKYVRPSKYLYLGYAIGIFVIHFFVTRKVANFPGKAFLFAPAIFPPIPWLAIFFLGPFAYYVKNYLNLILAGLTMALLIGLTIWDAQALELMNKFDMSLGYFLQQCFLIFILFYIFRLKKSYSPRNIIVFFGKYSLLFLFMHTFIIEVFIFAQFKDMALFWLIVFALTYICMQGSLYFNVYVEKFFNHLVTWLILLALIFGMPLIFKGNFVVIKTLAEIFGIFFALNYKQLPNALKLKKKPKAPVLSTT
jgi:hypothetical protein